MQEEPVHCLIGRLVVTSQVANVKIYETPNIMEYAHVRVRVHLINVMR